MTEAHAAATPKVLPAVSPWNMHYADDSCLLVRNFGTGQTKLVLGLEQAAPSEFFSITLMSRAFGGDFSKMNELDITFGPGGKPQSFKEVLIGKATTGEKLPLLLIRHASLFGPSVATPLEAGARGPVAEARLTQLTIDRKSGPDFLLELGAMNEPMAALRACTDDLLRGWGLDPAVQNSLKQFPTPKESPANWFTAYPDNALGKSSFVRYRLIIDAMGKIKNCTISSATQGKVFEQFTCDLFKQRGLFNPALDAQGRPVESYYTGNVTWLSNP